ncbi:hypothetical protein LNI91_11715 [Tenacibaculum dicentrarchi]|nr:hypothetical protein [Tenacibaculum dicentrarchi]
MRKFILSGIVILLSTVFYAQELPTIIPPSPEASALAKFTNVPVSHYTGLPNIEIPIHTIKQKGVQIPIRLSYHARGVKVAEIAPRTGTGWSLIYGGSISRQIRGMADDSDRESSYFSIADKFRNYPESEKTRRAVLSTEAAIGFDYFPDQFNFNAGNISGKFIFDYNDLKPLIQSYGDFKIICVKEVNKIESFKIIDARGNTYYYGISKDGKRKAREFQYSSGSSIYYYGNDIRDPVSTSSSEINFTSWKLMDVETYTGELISYSYEKEYFIRYSKSGDRHESSNGVSNSAGNFSDITKISSKISRITSHEFRLKKITFNQGSISFKRSTTAREDYDGYTLDEIEIYDSHDLLIKSFKLNYTYTESLDHSSLLPYINNSATFNKSFKRLFLRSIGERSNKGKELSPYIFTYNSTKLPNRFSTKQDYWGYFNDVNNGPFLRIFNYGTYIPDRRVNPLKSEAGILKEIKYPTGGKVKFTYEDNIGKAQIDYGKILIPNINPSALNPSALNPKKLEFTKKDFLYNSTSGYTPKNITIPIGTKVKFRFNCHHFRHVDDLVTPDCLFKALYDGNELNSKSEFVVLKKNHTISILTPIFPGIKSDLHLKDQYDFKLTFIFDKKDAPDKIDAPDNLYAGGKRIKKVEHIYENNTIVKEYDYNGSGKIIGLPSFINKKEGSSPPILTAYYDSNGVFGTFQPNSIGYTSVTEYNGAKESNKGKTEYTFSFHHDGGGDYYEFPYHPPTDNEWLRGKNIETKIFDKKSPSEYLLKKKTKNKYLYANHTTGISGEISDINIYTPLVDRFRHVDDLDGIIKELPSSEDLPESYQRNKTRSYFKLPLYITKRINTNNNIYNFYYKIYYLTGGTQNLWNTIETNYFEGNQLSSTTEYFYDYDKHYQLAGSESINSRGELYKINNEYDVLENSSGDLFRVLPTQIKTYKGSTKLSEQNTVYKDFNGLYLPKTIQTLKGISTATNILEDRVVYHNYDDKGNPIEVSKKDGTKIYYVWGYEQTQPIAKITGYSTITEAQKTVISNAVIASNADKDEATENNLRAKLKLLRKSFDTETVQVNTYTYDPLIGVTSITDPRGQTIYYEYDTFNRLEFIKGKDGNILKENKYNYKN